MNMNNLSGFFLTGLDLVLTFVMCLRIPKGATQLNHSIKEKYLGKWYEVARLDFKV